MDVHRIRGESLLAPFRPSHDYRPALDAIAARGANLARAFCGPLPWCGQTQGLVYDGLDQLCLEAGWRGLHVYPSYCTEAGLRYDLEAHVAEVEAITRQHPIVTGLKEVANEAWHATQGGELPPMRCLELKAMMAGTVILSACRSDEVLDDWALGDAGAGHLDRGRDGSWNMGRRVRELEAMRRAAGRPWFNQERIGAAEQAEAGRRANDPAIFWYMAALDVLFNVGGLFHSQDGLWARPLGPVQEACAVAHHAGSRIWTGDPVLAYRNTRHTDDLSPFADADLLDEHPTREDGSPNPYYNPHGSVIRLYAGIEPSGRRGFAVAGGCIPGRDWKIRLQHGWRLEAQLGAMMAHDGRLAVAWVVER